MTNDKNLPFCRLLSVILCILILFFDGAGAAEVATPRVAVVVSQRISPYLTAAEGLRKEFAAKSGAQVKEFELDRFMGRARNFLAKDLRESEFDLFIAIGPAAARFIQASLPDKRESKFYTMVLNPERVPAVEQFACGIAFGVSPQVQLQILSCGIPTVRRVGILYDPSYNKGFVEEAAKHAPLFGLTIVPFEVSSKTDIPFVLKQSWHHMDALLLIPDRTVISESLVEYIIKEAILEGVPVVGYNSFFYESGAALAFFFDYEEVGRQTARLALKVWSGEGCEKQYSIFQAWLNGRVMKHLKIPLRDRYPAPLEVGP